MKRFLIVLCSSAFLFASVEGAITIHNGQVWSLDEVALHSPEQHYALAGAAYDRCEWKEAAKQFNVVSLNYPNHPLAHASSFFLGVCYFHLGDFEFANISFNDYISSTQGHPEFFEDAICYKLEIAHAFREGECRHLFGMRKMPRWLSADNLAIEIYDEVIAAAPSHEAAVQALYYKAYLQWRLREYLSAITSLEILVKRFPKHELAPESFVTMNRIYLDWSQFEFQNPDILAMAEINQRKFEEAFPGEERLCEGETDIQAIKESYARGLYETGKFYERTYRPEASVLYYKKAIKQFPDTEIAQKCYRRLTKLGVPLPQQG